MAKIDSSRALELKSRESIIGYEFGDFIRDMETNSAPSPIPADVFTHNHDIRIYLRGTKLELQQMGYCCLSNCRL